jgi:hypothetical protein
MFISHRFGSVETMSRARHWLTNLGFEVAPFDPKAHDASRLTVRVALPEAAAALSLIGSIEGSDPEGWPGLMATGKTCHHHGEVAEANGYNPKHGPKATPIHWHKHDEASPSHSVTDKMSEYMFSRWE